MKGKHLNLEVERGFGSNLDKLLNQMDECRRYMLIMDKLLHINWL